MSEPLRILYAWDRLLPTTATDAEQATSTMSALARRGNQVTLLLPRPRRGQGVQLATLQERYQLDPSIQLVHAQVPLVDNIVARKTWYATRLLRADLPAHDLVYTRNSGTFLSLSLRGLKVAYDTHRAWPDHVPVSRPIFRALMQRPGFLGALFHSEYARQSYLRLGIPAEKLRTVHNGYDPSRFQSRLGPHDARRALDLPLDRQLVVYTGHISRLKGLDSLLGLAERIPEALFLLVGSEKDGSVERAARRLSNVKVLPWQPYQIAAQYMVSADVLILPPSSVGLKVAGHTVLPMKLFGYLAAGRALFAPSTPDVRELLTDGENAVLVEPGDIEHAANQLRTLLHDDVGRARLAAHARATGADLTWDARAEKIERFLRERLES